MRRRPRNVAVRPAATRRSSTAAPSTATQTAWSSLPKVSRDTGAASTNSSSAPSAPSTAQLRASTRAVRATRTGSALPVASATWRTPLASKPSPATPTATSATEV